MRGDLRINHLKLVPSMHDGGLALAGIVANVMSPWRQIQRNAPLSVAHISHRKESKAIAASKYLIGFRTFGGDNDSVGLLVNHDVPFLILRFRRG